jgi:hypothetical protein
VRNETMDLVEKAEQLSEKYDVKYSQVYDLMIYADFKMLVNHPIKRLFGSSSKNEEAIYALTERYLQRQEYKMSQGIIKELIPVYDF